MSGARARMLRRVANKHGLSQRTTKRQWNATARPLRKRLAQDLARLA